MAGNNITRTTKIAEGDDILIMIMAQMKLKYQPSEINTLSMAASTLQKDLASYWWGVEPIMNQKELMNPVVLHSVKKDERDEDTCGGEVADRGEKTVSDRVIVPREYVDVTI